MACNRDIFTFFTLPCQNFSSLHFPRLHFLSNIPLLEGRAGTAFSDVPSIFPSRTVAFVPTTPSLNGPHTHTHTHTESEEKIVHMLPIARFLVDKLKCHTCVPICQVFKTHVAVKNGNIFSAVLLATTILTKCVVR
jgi:hypothetical protein